MNRNRIEEVCCKMRYFANRPNSLSIPISASEITNIREELLLTAKDIEQEYAMLSNQLMKIKDNLFREVMVNFGTRCIYINPFVFGRGIEVLDILLTQDLYNQYDWWQFVHPKIAQVSKKLFLDGNYANAACDAYIEINDRVKKLYQVMKPGEKIPDGDAVMKAVFSANNPIAEFCNRSTDSGFNTQKGFMEMLAGSMSALRNPKAHANITISLEDAMRRLVFASMLMYKIDEAVSYSKIVEITEP